MRRRVDAGESDSEIRAYYVGRYGPGILLSPSGSDARLVWLTPLVAVGLATVLLGAAFRRWTRRAPVVLEVEDEALVADERMRRSRREEAR